MRQSVVPGALVLLLGASALPGPLAAPCQTGVASAPYIGAADMRAIDRAAATLPTMHQRVTVDVGSAIPSSVQRAPVPDPVVKVLPQYRGYSAFRVGTNLMIVDAGGILAYVLPLRGSANPANCP